MWNWKKISIAGLVVLLIGTGAALYLQPRPVAVLAPVTAPQSAAPKDLVLQGRAYCSLTVIINAPMTAKVTEVLAQVGQAVKKDDPLLRLELLPNDAAAMMQRANKGPAIHAQELLIQQYELKMNQLDRNIAEMQKLEAAGLAPRNSLPELLEQKAYGVRQIENARQTLADARRTASEDLKVLSDLLGQKIASGSQPRFLIVRAPQDGHVIGVETTVTPGATVGGKVMTLGVMDPMFIRGQVHESEIDRLKAGETASISLDSSNGPPMEAKLTSVSWAAQDSSLAAPSYYMFELTVPNPDLAMRDGNKVQVTFKAKPTAEPAQQTAQQPVQQPAPQVSQQDAQQPPRKPAPKTTEAQQAGQPVNAPK